MFYLFFRAVSALAITISLSLPASAQAIDSDEALYFYGLRLLLVAVAALVTAYFARNAFEAPIATPEDDRPVPPRYMTQPRQYWTGMTVYVGLCLAAYAVIVGYYNDLAPLLELAAPPEFRPIIETGIKQNAMSFPVVVVLGVAVLAAMLNIKNELNPLSVLRRQVWGWASVPELANTIKTGALNDLIVPKEAREKVAGDTKNHVDIGDFEKDRTSVDRKWAELCYVRLWLTNNLDGGSHNTFFNEPSFSWRTLESDFVAMRDRITRLKQAPKAEDAFEQDVFDAVNNKAETLRKKYCRLAAFFILFKNSTKKGAVRDANDFGVKIVIGEARANPMRYIVMFILAIVASIYTGVWMSATVWDFDHPMTTEAAVSAVAGNAAAATSWVYYGLATFGAPISVTLLLRLATWKYDAEEPDSYPTSYAVIVAIALCVSVASLALATRLGHGPHAHDAWIDLISRDFKWGWAPALICVYVVYHIDRQIDPLLPDIGKLGGEGASHRIFACFSFAILVTLLSVLPAASLEVQPDSPWSIGKLHAVVIGTIFTIGFVMALVSQFCLVKPRQPTDTSTTSAPALQPTS